MMRLLVLALSSAYLVTPLTRAGTSPYAVQSWAPQPQVAAVHIAAPQRSVSWTPLLTGFLVSAGLTAGLFRKRKALLAVAPTVRDQLSTGSLLDLDLTTRAERGPANKVKSGEKLKIGVIGAGLAGMITAMDLAEAGHDVQIVESRRFLGGKVSSWQDKDGNHIEMGLHVFFGCYYNLFGIFKRLGLYDKALRLKEHNHTFIEKDGKVTGLDFRFNGIGAPFNGLKAFATSGTLGVGDKIANAVALGNPLTCPIVKALVDFDAGMRDVRDLDGISFSEWFEGSGGSRGSIERLWDPIAYALGFIDCDNISARCMLTIFQLFAVRTDASVLRMLEGSPENWIHKPIEKYLNDRGCYVTLQTRIQDLLYDVDEAGKPTRIRGWVSTDGTESKYDVVVAACDVPGIQKLLPQSFRDGYTEFDNIYKLDAVPVCTVQLRFDGWVTELDGSNPLRKDVTSDYSDGKAPGIDNLLYTADAEFSCFADLALTSPSDYYKEGEGSLLQCVFTPGDKWMPLSSDKVAEACLEQARVLFPTAKDLNCTWTSVVKLGQSLYREAPGMDKYRPNQRSPVDGFYLAGSYTYQDYIDSMEGATKSGLMCADTILADTSRLAARDGAKELTTA
jgi:zeta-carotene desaturase